MKRLTVVLAGLGVAAIGGPLMAQEKPTSPTPLAVGEAAPEFTLRAATKSGVTPEAVKLKDFRGQTVVLAFFYKARTGG